MLNALRPTNLSKFKMMLDNCYCYYYLIIVLPSVLNLFVYFQSPRSPGRGFNTFIRLVEKKKYWTLWIKEKHVKIIFFSFSRFTDFRLVHFHKVKIKRRVGHLVPCLIIWSIYIFYYYCLRPRYVFFSRAPIYRPSNTPTRRRNRN